MGSGLAILHFLPYLTHRPANRGIMNTQQTSNLFQGIAIINMGCKNLGKGWTADVRKVR